MFALLTLGSNPTSIALGMAGIVFVALVGWRVQASIDSERIRHRGLFAYHDFEWARVRSVTCAISLPYPQNRFHGGLGVRTSDARFFINPYYFGSSFSKAFFTEVHRRRLIRSARQ